MSKSKNAIFFLMLFSLLLSFGCSTKKNETSSGTSVTPPSVSDGASVSTPLKVESLMSYMLNQMPACQSSGSRRNVYYSTTSIGSTSTILIQGGSTTAAPTGEVKEYYMGTSAFNDMMIVFKMADASFTIGIAFCPYTNLITSDRGIGKFYAQQGITLASKTTQNFGSILAAKDTWVWLDAYNGYPATWFGPTTFYPVTIK